MIQRSYVEIARMAGGRASGLFAELQIRGVSKDTRTIRPGNLYIPLIGERFDGHDYVREAIDKGAAASLWQADHPHPPEGVPLIVVDHALEGLQQLARSYLDQLHVRVVGITGSNGKTTTKDFVASVLGTTYRVHKTAGNLNGDIGLPLTILELADDTEIAVLEMGMRGLGEIELLSRLARPHVAVITNVGEAHLERLGSRENIARAKLEILSGLREDGRLVYNGDDPLLEQLRTQAAKPSSMRLTRFGLSESGDLYPSSIELDGDGTHFTVGGREAADYYIPLLGRHNVVNALAAIAVGRHFRVSEPDIAEGLRRTQPTGMRIELVKGKSGLTVLNDAYNASPLSLRASLELFREMKGYARKFVVLGDMLELGPEEERLHREIGAMLSPDDYEYVFTFGERAAWIAGEAAAAFPPGRVRAYRDKKALGRELAMLARPRDIVLVKGSRGMKLEEVVLRLAEAGP